MYRLGLITLLCAFTLACGMGDRGGPATDRVTKDRDTKKGKADRGKTPAGGDKSPAGGGSGKDCDAFARSGKQAYEFEYKGKTYEMPISAPKKGESTRRAVIMLHGGKGGPGSIVKQTQLFPRAEANGFLAMAPGAVSVMLPKGEARERWKNGHYDDDPAVKFPRNDVQFLDALGRHLKDDLCVDKLLAVGFSNGGSMGHRWLCEGKELDALVSAAGTLQIPDSNCKGSPKPVLEYIGTEDSRYSGPAEPGSGNPSAPETLEYWKKYNGCKGKGKVEKTGDTRCETWSDCNGGAETRICVITGLGHSFPSTERCDLEGSDDAWAWFERVVP